MKIYTFGEEGRPVILLIPGTCCSWHIFDGVVPGLAEHFRVECLSFDGFDESENTTFVSMEDEAQKVEAHILAEHGGEIRAAYGCSLGGTLAAMLVARGKVKVRYAFIGSSDFDTAGVAAAKLQTALVVKMLYPMVKTGEFTGLTRRLMRKTIESGDPATVRMLRAFGYGTPRPYVTRQSVANQFYTDLITVLPDKTHASGTEFHVFYAKKMGEKYLARYQKYLADPIIHEDDLKHEELLLCYPAKWVQRITEIAGGEE